MMSRLFLNLHEAVSSPASAEGILDTRRTITILFASREQDEVRDSSDWEEHGEFGTSPDTPSIPGDMFDPDSDMSGSEISSRRRHQPHSEVLEEYALNDMRDGNAV